MQTKFFSICAMETQLYWANYHWNQNQNNDSASQSLFEQATDYNNSKHWHSCCRTVLLSGTEAKGGTEWCWFLQCERICHFNKSKHEKDYFCSQIFLSSWCSWDEEALDSIAIPYGVIEGFFDIQYKSSSRHDLHLILVKVQPLVTTPFDGWYLWDRWNTSTKHQFVDVTLLHQTVMCFQLSARTPRILMDFQEAAKTQIQKQYDQ